MRSVLSVVATLLCFTLSTGSVMAGGHEIGNVEQLKAYYIKEDLDLSQYSKVQVADLKVSYARVIAPPWHEDHNKQAKKWALTNKDIEFLRKSYREAMTDALEAEDGYPVVSEAAADVIVIDIEIITLMPYARKGENVQVRGFGELVAQATIRDGATGNLIAIFEGSQDVGSEYQQNSRLNAENSLRALFDVWGARVRAVLDNNR